MKCQNRQKARKVTKDEACRSKWGHGIEEHNHFKSMCRSAAKGYQRSPLGAFARQRKNARRRGIPWKLLFAEWWSVWDRSGKWLLRGRGQSHYVMSRYADRGAYEVGNIFIQPSVHNNSTRSGKNGVLPLGVRRSRAGRRYTARKIVEGKMYHLGTFDTPEEASAAYQGFLGHYIG